MRDPRAIAPTTINDPIVLYSMDSDDSSALSVSGMNLMDDETSLTNEDDFSAELTGHARIHSRRALIQGYPSTRSEAHGLSNYQQPYRYSYNEVAKARGIDIDFDEPWQRSMLLALEKLDLDPDSANKKKNKPELMVLGHSDSLDFGYAVEKDDVTLGTNASSTCPTKPQYIYRSNIGRFSSPPLVGSTVNVTGLKTGVASEGRDDVARKSEPPAGEPTDDQDDDSVGMNYFDDADALPAVYPEPAVDPPPTVDPQPAVDPQPTVDLQHAVDPQTTVDPPPSTGMQPSMSPPSSPPPASPKPLAPNQTRQINVTVTGSNNTPIYRARAINEELAFMPFLEAEPSDESDPSSSVHDACSCWGYGILDYWLPPNKPYRMPRRRASRASIYMLSGIEEVEKNELEENQQTKAPPLKKVVRDPSGLYMQFDDRDDSMVLT